jgi:hypothetical protein
VSTYWDVLNQVKLALCEVPLFQECNVKFAIRKRPALVPLQDSYPQCVISPRAELDETLEGRTSESQWIGYPVYIGLFTDARWDEKTLRFRLDAREAIRQLLIPPKSMRTSSNGIWNVSYTASPSISFGDGPAAPEVDYSWQLFVFIDSQPKPFR